MTDTPRSFSALQALLADNTSGDISAQDVRDFLASVTPPSVYWTQLLSDDGSSLTGWTAGNGTWSVSSGTFLQADNTQNQAALMRSSGAPYQVGQLVKYEATIRWPSSGAGAGTQEVGFLHPGSSLVSGSYTTGMAQLLVGRTSGGARQLKIDDGGSAWTFTPSGSLSLDTDYALKIIVQTPNRAHFYIDGTYQGGAPFHEWTDFRGDSFGLTTRAAKASFDNIVVSHIPIPTT